MSLKILLVEDHDANRAVISRRLQRRGFEVTEACDGLEAIDLVDAAAPDVMLLDLSMPKISGFETLKRIRTSAAGANLPAIAVTAHAMDTVRQSCAEAGFQDFVTKPIDFEHLVQCIAKHATQKP